MQIGFCGIIVLDLNSIVHKIKFCDHGHFPRITTMDIPLTPSLEFETTRVEHFYIFSC